jgi:hypothetical protein
MNLMHVPLSAPAMVDSEKGKGKGRKEGNEKEWIGKSVIIKNDDNN